MVYSDAGSEPYSLQCVSTMAEIIIRFKLSFLIAGLANVPNLVELTVPYGTGNMFCCRKGLYLLWVLLIEF